MSFVVNCVLSYKLKIYMNRCQKINKKEKYEIAQKCILHNSIYYVNIYGT